MKHAETDSLLEQLYQNACANAEAWELHLLQKVKDLGQYPKRSGATDSLAKKVNRLKKDMSDAGLRYLDALQARDRDAVQDMAATERREAAEALMQKVRALGHLPRDTVTWTRNGLSTPMP